MRNLICLFFAVALPLMGRTWTSTDGRTMEGELTGKTDAVATIKRADGLTVNVPLAALSSGDQAFVKAAKVSAPRDIAAELEKLKKEFPEWSGPTIRHEYDPTDPAVRDCVDKYSKTAARITVGTLAQNIQWLNTEIERDAAKYDAQVASSDRSKSTKALYFAAKGNAYWLKKKVKPWVAKLAALAD